ncbi:MAG: bifunctional folylpolyglutamate synthase/dihydrofolate synthase, partial [Bacilli bacterium]
MEIHNYASAREWIHSRLQFGIVPGLGRMHWMMKRLNNPNASLRTVHIAGTNGKGSTVQFLRTILQSSGYRVGTFTSPYVVTFNERISVDGQPISDEAWTELVQTIAPLADEMEKETGERLTEFEAITCMMFHYFAAVEPVDIVIVEVGLGGLYDSTNIITPIVTAVTSIGYDHSAVLGETLEAITMQKAGIIKPHVPVVSGVWQAEAQAIIERSATENGSTLQAIGKELHIEHLKVTKGGVSWQLDGQQYVSENLHGAHQARNATVAIAVAKILKQQPQFINITPQALSEGVRTAVWPGRLELMCTTPLVYIDGAHNEEGVETVTSFLQTSYPNTPFTILFAAIHGKPVRGMLQKLEQVAGLLVVTT